MSPKFQMPVGKHKLRSRNRVGRLGKLPSHKKSIRRWSKPAENEVATEATPAEVAQMVAEAQKAPEPVVCPLCRLPITVEDAVRNMKAVELNGQKVAVHKTCPTEVGLASKYRDGQQVKVLVGEHAGEFGVVVGKESDHIQVLTLGGPHFYEPWEIKDEG